VDLTKKLSHEAYFIVELRAFSHFYLSRVRQSFDAEGTKNGEIAKNRCFFHLIRHKSDVKLSTTNGKRNKRSFGSKNYHAIGTSSNDFMLDDLFALNDKINMKKETA
jgi:hypothetical protein